MADIVSILRDGHCHGRLEEVKKKHGDPPWSERIIITDQIVGTLICQPPDHPNDRHYHIYDEWWVVMKGEIHWEMEGQSEVVKARAGDIVFAPKNHFHLIHPTGDGPSIRLAISVPGEPHRHER